MQEVIELLSPPVNYAVVQLPGRRFPGVVIQGDTLHSLVLRFAEMVALAQSGDAEELVDGLKDVQEQFSDALLNYEKICIERKLELPYAKS